jgi:GT2 family glycosyltransferase
MRSLVAFQQKFYEYARQGMGSQKETHLSLVGAVIIGRNEGKRLLRCIASIKEYTTQVVYVDSGSNDGSVEAAHSAGVEVVLLDTDRPFTAARARNAGLAALIKYAATPSLVQFIDGDCEVRKNWLPQATAFLAKNPEAAVVCGRRRERFPDASVYNKLIDAEWDTPIGPTRSCGGDALMRIEALQEVGGYCPNLIAGEEPELCVRLRQAGWAIWRLDAEMTLHDAAMVHFSQWWQRSKRSGYAFAEGAAMHGGRPERHCVAALRRIIFWGIITPLATILGTLITPWTLLFLLAWPTQVFRLRLRGEPWYRAFFLTISKIPEALGAIIYLWRRLTSAPTSLIEYKQPLKKISHLD